MKKISLVLCLTALCFSAMAQSKSELKPFKVDVSIGYAIPAGIAYPKLTSTLKGFNSDCLDCAIAETDNAVKHRNK